MDHSGEYWYGIWLSEYTWVSDSGYDREVPIQVTWVVGRGFDKGEPDHISVLIVTTEFEAKVLCLMSVFVKCSRTDSV